MPSNPFHSSDKQRLYVALYARGVPATDPYPYHYALISGPKSETGDMDAMRYHVKQRLVPGTNPAVMEWHFDERQISTSPTHQLLVRVTVAKVKDWQRTVEVLRNVPVQQNNPNWNCVHWVEDALRTLESDGVSLGTNVAGNWEIIRATAEWYVQKKTDEHRFDGQATQESYDMAVAPTWDMLTGEEALK